MLSKHLMKEQMSKLCDKLVISHISNSPIMSDIIPVWTQLRKVFLLPLPRTFKSQMDRGWEGAQSRAWFPRSGHKERTFKTAMSQTARGPDTLREGPLQPWVGSETTDSLDSLLASLGSSFLTYKMRGLTVMFTRILPTLKYLGLFEY